MKFTQADMRRMRTPGKYNDGQGLILHVITKDRRNWFLRYMRAGKERMMGLGSADVVSLDDAREKAQAARKLLAASIDPIDSRRAEHQAIQAQQAAKVTFAVAAAHYIAAHEAGWRNPKHRQQWRNTLTAYVEPIIGAVPVADVDANMVLRVLQPIWNVKPETASRVRSRVEMVLDYATARGWRTGSNPAIWRGNLKLMLPGRAKVRAVKHHAALDWREAPAFMAELRERDGMGAAALVFAILTAARSGEVRGARWTEIDIEHAVWTVPAARMEGGREHRVPLSASALVILAGQRKLRDDSGLVFHGHRHGTPMSDMTLTAVLRRMGRGDLTQHGFRSTFRDWVADCGKYPADIAEAALAHTTGDKTVVAYKRTDLFDPRRKLMADWAAFLARPAAKIVRLRKTAVADDAARTMAKRTSRR
jgi:integrase